MKYLSIFFLIFASYGLAKYEVVFEENWENNNNSWEEIYEDDVYKSVENGVYVIDLDKFFFKSSFKEYRFDKNLNYKISIEAKFIKGDKEKGFGLYWGASNFDNAYRFGISSRGACFIDERYKGDFTEYLNEKEKFEDIINSKETNTLVLEKKYERFFYSVNGVKVYESADFGMAGWGFGVFVIGEQKIEFDNLKIETEKLEINLVENSDVEIKKINLGPNINSTLDESAALPTANGKKLYFIKKQEDGDGTLDQIYVSEIFASGDFSRAKRLPFPINNDSDCSLISTSSDGNILIIQGRYDSQGQPDGEGMSISYKTKKGWTLPKNIDVENYVNNSEYTSNHVSDDRQYLIVSIINDESYGVEDLYLSKRISDYKYGKPINLGQIINTPGAEFAPFLASDNKTLYFSSQGHPGFGNADIFVTKRLDDTWQNWSEPKNLGPYINSDAWDAYFVLDGSGDYGYLVSSKDAIGGTDIFRFEMPKAAKPEPIIIVSGKVLNSETNEALSSEVLVENLKSKEVISKFISNPETGAYSITLPKGIAYSFNANLEGFYPNSELIEIENLEESKVINIDLYLNPIKIGSKVKLNNLFFDFNKATIKEDSYLELNKLKKLLSDNPKLKIKIGGHTDSKGDDAYNQRLSENRAKAVQEYLVKNGISESRISFQGYGESLPIAENDTEENMAKNRRVEFEILEN